MNNILELKDDELDELRVLLMMRIEFVEEVLERDLSDVDGRDSEKRRYVKELKKLKGVQKKVLEFYYK